MQGTLNGIVVKTNWYSSGTTNASYHSGTIDGGSGTFKMGITADATYFANLEISDDSSYYQLRLHSNITTEARTRLYRMSRVPYQWYQERESVPSHHELDRYETGNGRNANLNNYYSSSGVPNDNNNADDDDLFLFFFDIDDIKEELDNAINASQDVSCGNGANCTSTSTSRSLADSDYVPGGISYLDLMIVYTYQAFRLSGESSDAMLLLCLAGVDSFNEALEISGIPLRINLV